MDLAGRFKKQIESKEPNPIQGTLSGLGAFGLIGSSGMNYTIESKSALEEYASSINRASQAKKYFDKNIDPRLKNLYLQQGGYGLQYKAGDILQDLIPSTTTPFVPADLSLAGKYKKELKNIKPANYQADIITVTPGPNPARFATPELTSADTGEQGAKGYIWGNPDEPQWSYARGNLNKELVTTANPTLYMNRVDLAPESKGPFKTTGEVVADPTLIKNRLWGQRGQTQGDMYFPKENIKARGEVTAADLYTKLRSHGFNPEPLTNVDQPDKYFMNLAKQLATVEGTPGHPARINQVLENIATPVPALGVSERERGAIPVFKEFDPLNATSEQKTKAGINKIFNNSIDVGRNLISDDYTWDHVNVGGRETSLTVPYGLANEPSTYAGNSFKNINPLRSGAFAAGALYSPEIFNELEQGHYASALAKAGAAATTGALMEGAVRTGVVKAAQAGIATPARAMAAISPVAGPLSLVSQLGGSSRINKKFDDAAANAQMLRAEAARKRGGKWKFPTPFGQVTIPEFGISESGGLHFR
jgi:hypothetical protein